MNGRSDQPSGKSHRGAKAMRRLLLSLLLAFPLRIALADALWQTLPPTPPPVAGAYGARQGQRHQPPLCDDRSRSAGGASTRGLGQFGLLGASGHGTGAAPLGDPGRQPRSRPQHARQRARTATT